MESLYLQEKNETFCHITLLHALSFFFYFPPELRSDSEKKSQMESLKLEISSLKEQIVRQQKELQAKTAQVGKPDCCDRGEMIGQIIN